MQTTDHWMAYVLNELCRYRRRELYMKHALRISSAIMSSLQRNPEVPNYLGGAYHTPRSTPTATRMDGLLASYALARDFGQSKDAKRMWEAINLGVGFLLRTQIGPEKAIYLDDPEKCLGAFHGSLTDYEIRIDYVQHNISALLAFSRLSSQ